MALFKECLEYKKVTQANFVKVLNTAKELNRYIERYEIKKETAIKLREQLEEAKKISKKILIS